MPVEPITKEEIAALRRLEPDANAAHYFSAKSVSIMRGALPRLLDALQAAEARAEATSPQWRVHPLVEYHEDMGAVLWWRFPVSEPPYVGSPLDLPLKRNGSSFGGWPGYHKHFTLIAPPAPPAEVGK